MKHYAPSLWQSYTCDTPKKIVHIPRALKLPEKKIKRIDFIGVAQNLRDGRHCMALHESMLEAGIPWEQMQTWEYRDSVLVPCQAVLCEPVVFTFEDGMTLEVLPTADGALKASFNQMSEHTQVLNHSNVDASKLFAPLIGTCISKIVFRQITVEESGLYGNSGRQECIIEFLTETTRGTADCGMAFGWHYGDWYTVKLTNQHRPTTTGYSVKKVPYRDIRSALRPCEQIVIVEGHDCSSYFWICPVAQDAKEERQVRYHDSEEISIGEDDVFEFLFPFLEKYFDSEFPYICRDGYCGDGFEWNLEHNLYTYDTIRVMLDEIEKTADLLRHKFSDPALKELKKRFCAGIRKDTPSAERNKLLKERGLLAADFYKRFCRRMRLMMKAAPEFDLISFMGP